MSDLVPKSGSVKVGGLGPKAQKLQAMREKAAHLKSGEKPKPGASMTSFKASSGFKKTAFQRKSV